MNYWQGSLSTVFCLNFLLAKNGRRDWVFMGNAMGKVLAVSINSTYEERGRTVYDCARYAWGFDGQNPNGVIKWVLAIFHGEVKGIFKVKEWCECKGQKDKTLSDRVTDADWAKNNGKYYFEAENEDGRIKSDKIPKPEYLDGNWDGGLQ
jgi:hypothetical protein